MNTWIVGHEVRDTGPLAVNGSIHLLTSDPRLYLIAIGFTGDPVPPSIFNGEAMNRKL